MEPDKRKEALEILRRDLRLDLATGFVKLDELADYAVESLGDEYDVEELRAPAHQLLREELAAHLAAQRGWPAVIDCDRLDATFAELEEAGIVCRQHFSCCGSCGAVEIREEMETEQDRGREVRGYAFYHVQDTASAVHGDGIHLDYGSVLQGKEAAIRVGKEIVAAVLSHGLEVKWDGTVERRIGIKLDWKRRIPTASA